MAVVCNKEPATHMARIVPTILLHFRLPWRSDVGRYDSKEGIGRVESGTEAESNAYRQGWRVVEQCRSNCRGAVTEMAV